MPVWIQPRGRRDDVIGLRKDAVAIRLTAPPVDGAANKALCRFIADRMGVAASRVRIVRGQTSRSKEIAVEGFSPEAVRRVLREGLPLAEGGEENR